MTLLLNRTDAGRIRRAAEAAYPHECCGILLGQVQEAARRVAIVMEVDNERQDSRNNRFLIRPETLLKAEREARHRGWEVLGFYHSHPDAPARPSEFDREHAWPTYSYVIVSVEAGRSADLNSWRLSPDRSCFDSEVISDVEEVRTS